MTKQTIAPESEYNDQITQWRREESLGTIALVEDKLTVDTRFLEAGFQDAVARLFTDFVHKHLGGLMRHGKVAISEKGDGYSTVSMALPLFKGHTLGWVEPAKPEPKKERYHLENCPFCGGEAEMGYKSGSYGYYGPSYWVQCTKCDAEGPRMDCDQGEYIVKETAEGPLWIDVPMTLAERWNAPAYEKREKERQEEDKKEEKEDIKKEFEQWAEAQGDLGGFKEFWLNAFDTCAEEVSLETDFDRQLAIYRAIQKARGGV